MRQHQPNHTAQRGSRTGINRRELLRSGAIAGAGAVAASTLGVPAELLAKPAKQFKTKHVILVALAGGVRAKECIGTPENIPSMMAIAKQGVVLPSVRAANLGHYGAALAIFTGCPDARGIRENRRGVNPTIFEYLRKHVGLPAHEVWLSTTAGAQTVNFSHSSHKKYGSDYGANLIGTDGLFNAEFKDLMGKLGKAELPTDDEAKRVSKLMGSLDNSWLDKAKDRSFANDPEASLRIQRYILEELKGDTARITGPGSGDAKSIRVGRNLFRLFKPKLLSVVLQNADVAHGSYNSYVEVIRRNDKEIGMLWDSVQNDPELKESTSIFIIPEFGRDANLNERNGLDHGDGSEELTKVFCIAAGPDFKAGKTIQKGVSAIDICPTVATLLGCKAPETKGKLIKGMLA